MRAKIEKLFEYRKLPELVHYDNDKDQDTFLSKLYGLQEHIYYLDRFLESSWDIGSEDVKPYWTPIYESLTSLDIPEEVHDDYLHHIYRYQDHELSLRDGVIVANESIPYYYYYKSCDVKLIRRIIYENNPALWDMFVLSDWTLFDLITEIDDDIEDIEEDQDVLNGNGFVLNAHFTGIDETYSKFCAYLQSCIEKQRRKAQWIDDPDWSAMIKEWTIESAQDTRVLLEEKRDKIKNEPNILAQNRIVQKLEEKRN